MGLDFFGGGLLSPEDTVIFLVVALKFLSDLALKASKFWFTHER
jgi:hypothetical protein